MPVAISIQWKPLRDSHYVVASLQPGGAGLRQIFARQSTLREVQALVRSHPDQPFVGLLLGQRLDCSLTLAPYLLIESHVEVALASLDERAVSDAIRTLSGHLGRRNSAEVLGWYCTGRSTDATVSRTTAAVHAACFPERWQTVLTFGSGGNTGAFFLHDSRAARWFHAPFFEVTDSKASGLAPKPTCVAWPAYLTTASVVPLAETPQPVAAQLPPQRAFVHDPVSPPARPRPVAPARPVVTVRRTPARDAIVGMGRAAVSARRSALDFAKILVARAIATSRQIAERFGRIRAKWAASAARRKAEAESARAREEERRARQEERRAKEAAARRAAQEEAQRQAAEAEKRRAVEAEARRAAEAEARRIAAEDAERRRAAEAEVKRLAAEAEAQRRAEEARAAAERQAEEAKAEAQRRAEAAEAEAQRRAAEAEIEARRREEEAAAEARRREETVAAEARRRKEEADAQRAAEAEAQRKAAAEAERRAVEIEARRKAAEQAQRKAAEEAERKAVEMEARRKAAEEAQRKAAEEEQRRAAAEAQRRAAEADARRQAAEVEARRQAAEAESRRVAEAELEAQRQVAEAEAETQRRAAEAEEDARRKAAAAEEHARRMAAEAEALRISVEVAAIRERLARPPVEGSKREAPRAAADHIADIEDTTAADGPYRYLALARREGFEVSESIERGSPDRPETVWLLHKKESGLRLIVVTTDEEVREASLHYNLRTDDDSLLRMTAPEHRDLESRTIYGREACLHDLRARCRRLSATGALERDWKVTPTFQQPVSSHSLADAATPQR